MRFAVVVPQRLIVRSSWSGSGAFLLYPLCSTTIESCSGGEGGGGDYYYSNVGHHFLSPTTTIVTHWLQIRHSLFMLVEVGLRGLKMSGVILGRSSLFSLFETLLVCPVCLCLPGFLLPLSPSLNWWETCWFANVYSSQWMPWTNCLDILYISFSELYTLIAYLLHV